MSQIAQEHAAPEQNEPATEQLSIQIPEVSMVAELNVLSEWIPEQMSPGTLFVLENAGEVGEQEDPYWAVLACPECGTLGLVTRRQINGTIPVICGSDCCSAQFYMKDDNVVVRRPS
jgi:hypothetical protein